MKNVERKHAEISDRYVDILDHPATQQLLLLANSSKATALEMEKLERLLDAQPDEFSKRLLKIFLECIKSKLLGNAPKGNLYDSNLTMLDAFNVFYKQTPLVKFGHDFVNNMILSCTGGIKDLTVIDIGFGSGIQWIEFLKKSDKNIILNAIDVPSEHSVIMLERFKKSIFELNLVNRVELIPIFKHVEDIEFTSIGKNGFSVVNAALSLHHVLPEKIKSPGRAHVLKGIKEFEPDLFTLIEPDSDHNNSSFELVLKEALSHYSSVFGAINYYIKDRQYVDFIENNFFGKEIENIICNDGAERFERHERFAQWCKSLEVQGFKKMESSALAFQGKDLLVASAWRVF